MAAPVDRDLKKKNLITNILLDNNYVSWWFNEKKKPLNLQGNGLSYFSHVNYPVDSYLQDIALKK